MNIFLPLYYEWDFTRCISDNQLFVLRRKEEFVYLLKHVDDCMLAGPKNSQLLSFVDNELAKSYNITTEFALSNFVVLAITRDCDKRKLTYDNLITLIPLPIDFLLSHHLLRIP
jgi:hypothetical protein